MSRPSRSEPVSISGVVVHAEPGAVQSVRAALDALPGVITHAATAAGKIIATLETRDDAQTLAAWQHIGAQRGVLAVALAYHQIEDQPDLEA
jgi:nitrate reductase NapAB chaperone NapD